MHTPSDFNNADTDQVHEQCLQTLIQTPGIQYGERHLILGAELTKEGALQIGFALLRAASMVLWLLADYLLQLRRSNYPDLYAEIAGRNAHGPQKEHLRRLKMIADRIPQTARKYDLHFGAYLVVATKTGHPGEKASDKARTDWLTTAEVWLQRAENEDWSVRELAAQIARANKVEITRSAPTLEEFYPELTCFERVAKSLAKVIGTGPIDGERAVLLLQAYHDSRKLAHALEALLRRNALLPEDQIEKFHLEPNKPSPVPEVDGVTLAKSISEGRDSSAQILGTDNPADHQIELERKDSYAAALMRIISGEQLYDVARDSNLPIKALETYRYQVAIARIDAGQPCSQIAKELRLTPSVLRKKRRLAQGGATESAAHKPTIFSPGESNSK